MTSFMIKYKNLFLALTILFFLGSLGLVGAGVFMEEYGPNAPVATVGKGIIKIKDFDRAYKTAEQTLRQSGQEITEDAPFKLRQEVLQALINEESLSQAAQAYGLGVSDMEIGHNIRQSFSENGLFNKDAYIWVVRNNLGLNPADYEALFKKQKMAEKFQSILILAAAAAPQEAQFFMEGAAQEEAARLALLELKAQALMNSFTDAFNAGEKIEIREKLFETPEMI
jgi:hypothetical protein